MIYAFTFLESAVLCDFCPMKADGEILNVECLSLPFCEESLKWVDTEEGVFLFTTN